MSDYFDAYTAVVVSQFLEENDFDLENVETRELDFNYQANLLFDRDTCGRNVN